MARHYTIKIEPKEVITVKRIDPLPSGSKWPTKRVTLTGKTLDRRYEDVLAGVSASALAGGRKHSVTRRKGVYLVIIEENSLAAVADQTAALHASHDALVTRSAAGVPASTIHHSPSTIHH